MLTVLVTYHYFLGLKNLAIITDTLRGVLENYGTRIHMPSVDLDDKEVLSHIFADGETNSVFQFESPGMKNMLKKFKPTSIEDLILLVAAYRPGPMQFLDSIIDVKHGRKTPEYVIPEMESILAVTYGYPVYQEQIMQIFNKFAGFSLGEADIIRRYMSKKKVDKFMAYKQKFIDGLIANGAQQDKAEEFWEQLTDFSRYAFNKSHACAYAITAYYTGYLKYHYPKEYAAAVANYAEPDEMGKIIADARTFGAQVLAPDVNLSGAAFDTLDGHIRYGLCNIKNVASAGEDIIEERSANGMFTSFEDFMERTSCKKDVAAALAASGALDSISRNLGTNYISRRIALMNLIGVTPDKMPFDRASVLEAEVSVLGAYITENPAAGCKSQHMIADAEEHIGQTISVAGSIQDLQIKTTKKGDTMAVFNIIDADFDSITAVCFPDTYATVAETLKAGVCAFRGTVQQRDDSLQLIIREVKAVKPVVKSIVLTPENANDIKPYLPQIEPYKKGDGVPLVFMVNNQPKQLFAQPIKVDTSILEDPELAHLLTVTY